MRGRSRCEGNTPWQLPCRNRLISTGAAAGVQICISCRASLEPRDSSCIDIFLENVQQLELATQAPTPSHARIPSRCDGCCAPWATPRPRKLVEDTIFCLHSCFPTNKRAACATSCFAVFAMKASAVCLSLILLFSVGTQAVVVPTSCKRFGGSSTLALQYVGKLMAICKPNWTTWKVNCTPACKSQIKLVSCAVRGALPAVLVAPQGAWRLDAAPPFRALNRCHMRYSGEGKRVQLGQPGPIWLVATAAAAVPLCLQVSKQCFKDAVFKNYKQPTSQKLWNGASACAKW